MSLLTACLTVVVSKTSDKPDKALLNYYKNLYWGQFFGDTVYIV